MQLAEQIEKAAIAYFNNVTREQFIEDLLNAGFPIEAGDAY